MFFLLLSTSFSARPASGNSFRRHPRIAEIHSPLNPHPHFQQKNLQTAVCGVLQKEPETRAGRAAALCLKILDLRQPKHTRHQPTRATNRRALSFRAELRSLLVARPSGLFGSGQLRSG
jgi:hypothetical protein